MSEINAQIVNRVNGLTVNSVLQSPGMPKNAQTHPSLFWTRLTETWGAQGLPVSQNGVAKRLDMSQGSTRRWYTGEGLPELEKLRDIAKLGRTNIDYLLTGAPPKASVRPDSPLWRLLSIWYELDEDDQRHVLKAAEGQSARAKEVRGPESQKSTGRRTA